MREIINFITGVKKDKEEPSNELKIAYTVEPKNKPSQHDWFKEFNVSMLHDRRTVHFG